MLEIAMALWNEKPTPGPVPTGRKEPLTPVPGGAAPAAPAPVVERPAPIDRMSSDALAPAVRRPAPAARSEGGESVIAANLTIEGKIEGTGNVRIDGNFNIDPGAHLTGQVLAAVVVVGGELQGNIESAKRVDVLEGGVIVGDVKAGSITVAAGSRMRGHVEFGWDDEKLKKLGTVAGS